MSVEETKIEVKPVDKAKVRHLIKIAIYLALITFAEFAIAFTLAAGTLRTIIFIVMTIFKAYYIVQEFMHLGHEVKGLRMSVVLPMLLVLWLILALIIEGGYVAEVRL